MNVNLRRKRFACQTLGFTLIELLVVVAIIGVLIAILIPGLRLAQEAANDVVCKAQLDQIFKGIWILVNENDEALPNFNSDRPDGPDFWPIELVRALEVFERELFKCPSDANPSRVRVQLANGKIYSTVVPIPSGPNKPVQIFFDLSYRGYCDLVDRKITQFAAPDQALILTEIVTPAGRPCFYLYDILSLENQMENQTLMLESLVVSTAQRHMDASNFLLMDGHVERLDPIQAGKMILNTHLQNVGKFNP